MSDSQYMDHDQDFTFGYQFPADQMKVRLVCPVLQVELLEVVPHHAMQCLCCTTTRAPLFGHCVRACNVLVLVPLLACTLSGC